MVEADLERYGTFGEWQAEGGESARRRSKEFLVFAFCALALATAVTLLAVVAQSVSSFESQSPTEADLLLQQMVDPIPPEPNAEQTAEHMAFLRAKRMRDEDKARSAQKRGRDFAALIHTAEAELQADELRAKSATDKAQKQSSVVAALRTKIAALGGQSKDQNAVQLSAQEEQDAVQANALDQQANVDISQQQHLLDDESTQNQIAMGAVQSVSNLAAKAQKDETMAQTQQDDAQNAAAEAQTEYLKESPVEAAINTLNNQLATDQQALDSSMNQVESISRDAQAAQLGAQMDLQAKRRSDRDAAEQALNRAVAKEQELQNAGPDLPRKKLKGAAKAALVAAQNAVKKAQAKLAAAYSETFNTGESEEIPEADMSHNAKYQAAQKAMNAATAKVTADEAAVRNKQKQLKLLQRWVSKDESKEARDLHLARMLRRRANSDLSTSSLSNGQSAAAKEQEMQDAQRAAQLGAQAQAARAQATWFRQQRANVLKQLMNSEMGAKKEQASSYKLQTKLSAAAAQEAVLQRQAGKAYSVVAAQAKEVQELKDSLHTANTQAKGLFQAAGHVGDAEHSISESPDQEQAAA
mmetsp:Transcript_16765/g.39525  ORF Transcript_16765/g.39525 Transcript_16765/m.39525 type:complete len:584 (+) Transcript_16765:60-1811(+)